MPRRDLIFVGALAIFLQVVTYSSMASAQTLYHVTPLVDLPAGMGLCYPEDINDSGQITGSARDASGSRAVVWDTPTEIRILPALTGQVLSTPRAINNRGHVAGSILFSVNHSEAFLYSPQAGTVPLGGLPNGNQSSSAWGMNDSDAVVGASGSDAFIWTHATGMTALGVPPSTEVQNFASDVNSDGFVAGSSQIVGSATRAALWDPGGGLHWLPDLPDGSGYPFEALAINDAGQCLGRAIVADNLRAYVWSPDAGHALLPDIEACGSLRPRDINNLGQAVGSAHDRGDCFMVRVWDAARGMRVLNGRLDPCVSNQFSAQLWEVTAINNLGVIVGWVYAGSGAVLLTPYIAGDPDLDGDTDLNDLTILLSYYGAMSGVTFEQGDVDEDGDVDLSDLALLLARFGMTCA